MKIDSVNFYSSSGRRDVCDVEGTIEKNKVYFSLYDKDIKFISEYLDDIPRSVVKNTGYGELGKIDFSVPVIKFGNSDNVLLVYKNKAKREALKDWIRPKIVLLVIAYMPLIILLLLNKITLKND